MSPAFQAACHGFESRPPLHKEPHNYAQFEAAIRLPAGTMLGRANRLLTSDRELLPVLKISAAC